MKNEDIMTTVTQDYVRNIDKFNNCDIPETKSKKRKITSGAYRKKKSIKLEDLKRKWNVLKCDPPKNEGYECRPVSTETHRRKTPVSLLNEWAMCGSGSTKNTKPVSYVLIAITGQTHKPIFTYMCQVQDKIAKGQGLSKREAKQNAAAQMLEQLFKTDSAASSDEVITSTTITDKFEVNKHNYIDNLTSIEGSQIIDEANSNISDKKLQHSIYEEVQTAHCAMNPVGALQELSTTYKWVPPRYNFQKLFTLNTNLEQQHSKSKRVSYEVTCRVFHLQTMGTAITKKEAKRIAAHKMFDQIYDIGIDKLNELKSSEFNQIMLSNKDCIKDKFVMSKEITKSPPEWTSAHIFQLYVTTVNNKSVFVPSYPLFKSNGSQNLQKEQLEMKENQYQMELEQLILHYNPDLSSVYQLQSLCQQLGFQAIYTQLNNLELQKNDIKNITGKDEYYAIMLQVSTVPVTVTIGRAMTIDMASEVAAKHILHTFKAMWCYNSPSISKVNNNDQQIPNDDCITFL